MACCRVGRCWGGALSDGAQPARRAAGAGHNRGGELPGRHAASAAHGSLERSLADLGKNVPKTASVGPCFDTFLPEKMEDLLVGLRISATTTSAGLSAPSARPRARRISRRCSMSCEPVTAIKACPGQIPRAPRGGRRQIDRLERGRVLSQNERIGCQGRLPERQYRLSNGVLPEGFGRSRWQPILVRPLCAAAYLNNSANAMTGRVPAGRATASGDA